MNTVTTMDAPMVRIRPRPATATTRPRSVDAALALARIHHSDWWWLLELHSNVLVAGAVDLEVAAELIDSAPTDFLAGYVAGLVINN